MKGKLLIIIIFLFHLVPEGPEAEVEDSEEMNLLAADFEIGHMLRDSIIPKAVLYYTGEVGDEDEGDVSEMIMSSNESVRSC